MGWHAVAHVDEIGEDEALGVKIGEVPIAIVRAGGGLHAVHDVCTHQFALLSDGFVEDGCIECPLHQGRFELASGEAKCAPVTEPIKVYPVRVEGGRIMVELGDSERVNPGSPVTLDNEQGNPGSPVTSS